MIFLYEIIYLDQNWAIANKLSYNLIFVRFNSFLLSMAFLDWKIKGFCVREKNKMLQIASGRSRWK